MNVNWFKNSENVVYADAEKFMCNFAKEMGISDLREQIEEFQRKPSPLGKNISGTKRTSLKLMIPELMFQEHLEMGENVWIYLGETHPCYCLYWPEAE